MGNELGPQFAENSKAAESVENVYGPHQSGNTSGGTIHKEVETQIRIPQFKKFLAPDRQLQTPELAPSQEATEQAAHREVAVSREGARTSSETLFMLPLSRRDLIFVRFSRSRGS
jgi:hypothetical protein